MKRRRDPLCADATMVRPARLAPSRSDESGSSLLLALVFIVAIGFVLVSLASAVGNDLLNSSNLNLQRELEYAADGATSMAVQSVRYSGNIYSPPPVSTSCLPGGAEYVKISSKPDSPQTIRISVWCSQQQYDPVSGVTRIVNFYACVWSASSPTAPCSSGNAVLQAQVTFDDFSNPSPPQRVCTPGVSISTCGSAMTINSWILETGNH